MKKVEIFDKFEQEKFLIVKPFKKCKFKLKDVGSSKHEFIILDYNPCNIN